MLKRIILSIAAVLVCTAAVLVIFSDSDNAPEAAAEELPAVDEVPVPVPEPPSVSDAAPFPAVTPEAPHKRSSWTLSFAGDCTIGTLHEWQGVPMPHNMLHVINGDWSYPFSNVAEVFSADDLTLVNLEGTFTEHETPVSKSYRFRAEPSAVQSLTLGSIEAVTLANNHSGDYGAQGLEDTRAALDGAGVLRCEDGAPIITQLEDGPVLGLVAFSTVEIDLDAGDIEGYLQRIASQYELCAAQGCDLILIYLHWGWEYRSAPEQWMTKLAHGLADMGFDAVIGSHPHILQPFEMYADTPIFYSLGNFCFGGHSGPDDMDSVIIQQKVLREDDGFVLGETTFLPCSISGQAQVNDFCPRLYAEDESGYVCVMQKLGLKP